jgi:hypothetical protein
LSFRHEPQVRDLGRRHSLERFERDVRRWAAESWMVSHRDVELADDRALGEVSG